MSDLISRQKVMEVLNDCAVKSNMKGRVALLHARNLIHELPSVELGLEQKILRLEEENKKLKQEVRTLYDEVAEVHELGVEQI